MVSVDLKRLTYFVTLISVALNVFIYTYPSLEPNKCSWKHNYKNYDQLNDFQKRIIGTPYIGDLYDQYFLREDPLLTPQEPKDIRLLAIGDPQINGNWPSTKYVKRFDNYGNDYYLGHIYNVMKTRLQPTHVSVMGDLFSSQWISDSEFYNRTRRFMTRLFPRPNEQGFAQLNFIEKHEDVKWPEYLDWFKTSLSNGYFKNPDHYHYENIHDWTDSEIKNEPLFINITGNHDVGYGDTTYQHMARWNVLFGKENFWIEYDNDTDHAWRIVVLNSLALEGPMLEPEFQEYTNQFIEVLQERQYNGSTILLTHIPLYKKAGLCVDGPKIEYYTKETCLGADYRIGLLKSTNHLLENTSQKVLNAVFQNDRPGAILTGHDHEGCENFYNQDPETGLWEASKEVTSARNVHEITVRAIMGDYGGNTGIFTGHFNKESKTWEFDYSLCPFVVQHYWWAAKAFLVVSVLLQSICVLF